MDSASAPRITEALQELAAIAEVDVVVVARGGGSLADLFAFCDETLCRTVALLRVPVIASIGHHTDRTLPDERGELQLTDAIKLLIQRGESVHAWLLAPDQRRYDVGNFESYFRTFVDFALADERYGYLARKYIKAKAYEL